MVEARGYVRCPNCRRFVAVAAGGQPVACPECGGRLRPRYETFDRGVLDKAMARQGLTQAELARRVGLSRSTLTSYVNGWARVPADVLMAVASELRVRPADIWHKSGA